MNLKVVAVIGVIAVIAIAAGIYLNQDKEQSELEKAVDALDENGGYIYYKTGSSNTNLYVKVNGDVEVDGDYVRYKYNTTSANITASSIYKIATLDGQTWNF